MLYKIILNIIWNIQGIRTGTTTLSLRENRCNDNNLMNLHSLKVHSWSLIIGYGLVVYPKQDIVLFEDAYSVTV